MKHGNLLLGFPLAREWRRISNIGTAIGYTTEGFLYLTGATVGIASIAALTNKPNIIGVLGVVGAVTLAICGYKFHQEETLNRQRIGREYQRRASLLESKLKGSNKQ